MALSTSRTFITKTGISTSQVFDMGGINITGGDFNLGSTIKLGNSSGIITATSFSGNLSGTPTLGTGVTITAAGVVSATTYYGSGANLTGISGGVTSDAQENTVGGTNAGDSFNGTNATKNTLFGFDAGTAITDGDKNAFFGHKAGEKTTTGFWNVFIGEQAGRDNVGNYGNIAIGRMALLQNTSSNYSVAVGNGALINCSGEGNIGIGFDAGQNIAGTQRNTVVGAQAGDSGNTLGGNCMLLGARAEVSVSNVANEITLGDTNITHLRVPGIGVSFRSHGAYIAGVVTATSFSGGLPITNGADNRVITASSASAIQGESGLTFDGNNFNFTRATAGDARMYIYGGEGGDARLLLASDEGDDHIDNYEIRAQAADNALVLYQFESGAYRERLRVKNGGDIGVGVASPDGRVHIMGGNLNGAGSVTADNNGNLLVLESNETNGMSLLNANDERANIWFGTTGTGGNQEAGIQYAHEAVSTTADRRAMIFRGGGGERMRLQGQRLLVGRTNNIQVGGDSSDSCFEQITDNGYALTVHCDKANQRALGIYYNTGRTPEAAFAFQIGSSWKTIIRGDGDLENANNSYGGISDASMKENIVDANSQWNDIKNIKVRKFNYKAETGQQTHKQIGVIAQELETVSPKLVKESEGGMKTVSYSILYMKAIKALQEAQARIETLESKVAALEGS